MSAQASSASSLLQHTHMDLRESTSTSGRMRRRLGSVVSRIPSTRHFWLSVCFLLCLFGSSIQTQVPPSRAATDEKFRALKKMIDSSLKGFEDPPALQLCVALSNKLDQKAIVAVLQRANLLPHDNNEAQIIKVGFTKLRSTLSL